MSRPRSPTQKALDNLIFQPTRRSRNKPKPIPTASQVTTYDHGYVLRRAMWDRTRARRMS
ncbi:NinE family protein [Pectobacterium aroidearum]|uniref:NinE family protein n=1 Tax=Pectobacterium aroidearum TaxID=1201031 RepID=UPI003158BB99